MYKILVIDDDEIFLQSINNHLEYLHYTVKTCSNPTRVMGLVDKESFDVILLDIKMPGVDGMELLSLLVQRKPDIPIIMISGQSTIVIAVDAIKKGAFDFVEKPIDPERLKVAIKNALAVRKLHAEKMRLMDELKERYRMVGKSKALDEIIATIQQIANTKSKVLITGETGTGKELVARAIHFTSNRSSAPFIKLNCAAIPKELLESELFGHKKGAFSGAVSDHIGKFQAADGGTLFLDEIGDMDLMLQAKLLHVLQDEEFMMLGSNQSIKVDVRIVAATNHDIKELIKEKKFRNDLYHRLNVVNINIPPLRERKEDIEPLFIYFLQEFSQTYNKTITGWEPEVIKKLKRQPWPGNVRELKNTVEKMVIYTNGDRITLRELELAAGISNQTNGTGVVTLTGNLKEELQNYERKIIEQTLKETGGKVLEAARRLGINRTALFKKKKRLGIH